MNKDIRINWNIGMELTPETFIHLENQLAEYRLLLRKVQASKLFGLIPDTVFNASLSLNGDELTIGAVECHALLQHGGLIDIKRSENLILKIEGQSDSCYLTVWPTEQERTYELDEVPFIENEYQFGLRSLAELPGTMPLAKIVQEDGAWKLQDDYILPVMAMGNAPIMTEMIKAIRQLTTKIMGHEKFKLIRNHDVMRMLAEEMGSLDGSCQPKDFVSLCRRFARLLSYVVMEEPTQLVDYNPYDIQLFLYDICGFFIKAYELLPTLEVMEYQPIQRQEPEPGTEVESESENECPIL